jgi:hypothetical protein
MGEEYNGCSAPNANPYLDLGLKINNGIITSRLDHNMGYPTVFPFGSYYLDLNDNGGELATWEFVDPWNNYAPRAVTSVSFVVLGKSGDIITGAWGSGAESPDPQWAANRLCGVPAECGGWRNGFELVAVNPSDQLLYQIVVDPIPYGEAGYATGPQDFANIRVTISVSPETGGFSKLKFFQSPTRDINGNVTWGGMIAIDQITFDQAVPEPGTFAGVGAAVIGLLAWHRRRSVRQSA